MNYDGQKEVSLYNVQESKRDQLLRMKKSAESHIADINPALEILAKNPEIEELTDLLRRL